MKILDLLSEHLPEILEIERETFSDAWTDGMFKELLANPFTRGYIAENNGEMLGFIIFYNLMPELQILNIAVRESARNQSLGSILLKSALECENINWVTLEVRESNLPAINLYKKFGFKIDGVRKNYYNKPREDAILMSLDM